MDRRTATGESKNHIFRIFRVASCISLSDPDSANMSWVLTLCFCSRGAQSSPSKASVFQAAREQEPWNQQLRGARDGGRKCRPRLGTNEGQGETGWIHLEIYGISSLCPTPPHCLLMSHTATLSIKVLAELSWMLKNHKGECSEWSGDYSCEPAHLHF